MNIYTYMIVVLLFSCTNNQENRLMADDIDIQNKQKQKIYEKYFYMLDEREHDLDSFDYFRILYRSEIDSIDTRKTEIYTAKRQKVEPISNSNNENIDSFCYWFSKKTSKGGYKGTQNATFSTIGYSSCNGKYTWRRLFRIFEDVFPVNERKERNMHGSRYFGDLEWMIIEVNLKGYKKEEYYLNVYPGLGDSIFGLNKYFDEILITKK